MCLAHSGLSLNGAAIIILHKVGGGAQGPQPGLYLAWKGWGVLGDKGLPPVPGLGGGADESGRPASPPPSWPSCSIGSPWLEGSLSLGVSSPQLALCPLHDPHLPTAVWGGGCWGLGFWGWQVFGPTGHMES